MNFCLTGISLFIVFFVRFCQGTKKFWSVPGRALSYTKASKDSQKLHSSYYGHGKLSETTGSELKVMLTDMIT